MPPSASSTCSASSSSHAQDEDAASQDSSGSEELRASSADVDAFAHRVHLCLSGRKTLTAKRLRSAVRAICALKNMAEHGGFSSQALQNLLFAGVAVLRTIYLAKDDALPGLRTTLVLLFALQLLGRAGDAGDENAVRNASVDTPVLKSWNECSLWKKLRSARDEHDDDEPVAAPEDVLRTCLASSAASMDTAERLALHFFEAARVQLVYSTLDDDSDAQVSKHKRQRLGYEKTYTSGVSLAASSALEPSTRAARLAAVVDAAGSEAGQIAHRDLLLSFLLPPRVLGVRRALALGRAENEIARTQFSDSVQIAHEAAMAGASWEWENGTELSRLCALLAGAAMLLGERGGGADAIRRKDAFGSRCFLPFLATPPPPADSMCVCLVPHLDEWIVFSLGKRGALTLHFRGVGLRAAEDAVLVACR